MKEKNPISIKQLILANPDFKKEIPEGEPFLEIAEFFCDTIQGENFIGWPSTFLRLQHCTLNCVWCFGENTEILMEDFTTKPIKDIKVGDKVMGIKRNGSRLQTKLQPTLVTNLMSKDDETILVNGKTVVTPNHKFYYNKHRPVWQQIKNLHLEDVKKINYFSLENEDDYWKGWLSGIIDGDGCFFDFKGNSGNYCLRFKIGLNEDHVINLIQEKLEYFGFDGIQRRTDRKLSVIEMTQVAQTTKLKEFIGYKTVRSNISNDFKKGYLAGFFDAEGYQNKGEIRISQVQTDILEMSQQFAEDLGFRSQLIKSQDSTKVSVLRILDIINFFTTCQPKLKIYKPISTSTIKNYEMIKVGDQKSTNRVYNMTTEAGSYIADGYIVSNCDTQSVWRYGNPYTFKEIFELMEDPKFDLIRKFKEGQHLILTGGSPVKQQDRLIDFFNEFEERYDFLPFIEIENEGTLMPKQELIDIVKIWNNSPKLSHSGNPDILRYRPKILFFLSTLENSWFKFVVSTEEDWQEIKRDFLDKGLIRKNQIVLMPLAGNRVELHQNREFVIELAVRENVRYSSREHVEVWDILTGV